MDTTAERGPDLGAVHEATGPVGFFPCRDGVEARAPLQERPSRQECPNEKAGSPDPLDIAFTFGVAGSREATRAEIRQLLASPEMRRIFSETGKSGPAPVRRPLAEARAESDSRPACASRSGPSRR